MKIDDCINEIEKYLSDPSKGLPENLFLFISRVTPLINVDLLIKNERNQTLLIWRKSGQLYNEGWHVPGGIIRFKERINTRILEVLGNGL